MSGLRPTVRIITGRRCWLLGQDRPYYFNRNAGGAAVWFQTEKQLLILAVVNIITQIILNVLNVINYNSGPLAFTFSMYF